VLLETNNIDYDEDFSRAVNACLPPMDWKLDDAELARRTDLRHLRICSIDPATAKVGCCGLYCVMICDVICCVL